MNRRTFLQNCGVGLAALAVPVVAEARKKKPDVIGYVGLWPEPKGGGYERQWIKTLDRQTVNFPEATETWGELEGWSVFDGKGRLAFKDVFNLHDWPDSNRLSRSIYISKGDMVSVYLDFQIKPLVHA